MEALLAQPAPLQDELLRALVAQRRWAVVAEAAGVARVAEVEAAEVAARAEVAEAAEAGQVAVGEGGDDDDDDDDEWGAGGLRTAVSEPSYGQLRRVREQLQRPARTWSLELGGSVLLRRTGDLLEAVLAPGGGGSGSGGDGAAAEVLRWFEAYDAHGNVDVRVAHPAHCRLRVARLAEGSAAAGGAAAADAAAGAAGGAAGGEGMVLHNVPAGSRLLVRAWRDGDVHQPQAKPKPLKITALAARGHAPMHLPPCSAAAGLHASCQPTPPRASTLGVGLLSRAREEQPSHLGASHVAAAPPCRRPTAPPCNPPSLSPRRADLAAFDHRPSCVAAACRLPRGAPCR